ncbi:ABC transporter ATP-binding protein [Pseudoclavibacter endophyticus]|uniref:ABC transporter ATP-binding protein n=1 Tax=Pseudoclavibacter endophyticus TaxID=1778590 RepID=A0A6H9WM03_9MICO|nr:ABC transporter ATP-binding protein [Pseudoclavibacter endophyticus]KAB1646760.1 ABC transporter ATP-binding protein [Pseudoclavibacter endophyticus]GGA75803.1 ABC transporter ATP-binding protein [Pseudoclavibacter endophyticus]
MITFDRVTKRYARLGGSAEAVRDLSVTIRTGAITAVLGPNASGKTTMLRMLAGQLAPTGGTISIAGRPVATDARIPHFAVAHDGNNFGDSRLREYLSFARSRPGWSMHEYRRLADTFELPSRGYLHKLSLGQRAGFAIACALASAAPHVVIDEAHAGLDVPKRLALYEELVRTNAEDGRSIIIASHNVGELERIAEDAIVLRDGRLIEATEVDDLAGRFVRVIGPAEGVQRTVGSRRVVAQRELGATLEATVDVSSSPLDPSPAGVVVTPVDFQEAFVALLGRQGAGMPGDDAAHSAGSTGAHANSTNESTKGSTS